MGSMIANHHLCKVPCKMTSRMLKRILITAGATREPIDKVRFISNHSSGKLGCQLALAGAIAGHEVTLLAGDGSRTPPIHPRLHVHRFTTTKDLEAQLNQHWPSNNVLIMAAAVADFTPRGGPHDGKLSRKQALSLELVPTQDLVAGLALSSRKDQMIIAFVLEDSGKLEETAKNKLQDKGVHAIIANPLGTMHADNITATVYCQSGRTFSVPEQISKSAFATWLFENLHEICTEA